MFKALPFLARFWFPAQSATPQQKNPAVTDACRRALIAAGAGIALTDPAAAPDVAVHQLRVAAVGPPAATIPTTAVSKKQESPAAALGATAVNPAGAVHPMNSAAEAAAANPAVIALAEHVFLINSFLLLPVERPRISTQIDLPFGESGQGSLDELKRPKAV